MPAKTCTCGGRIRHNECDRCGPVIKQEFRESPTDRGYSSRWTKVADKYKEKHPICVCCAARGIASGKRGRGGIVVDHIIPAKLAPELFYEQRNWQTLCHSCDDKYKKPLERRCKTAKSILVEWNRLLERFACELDEC